MEIQKTLKMLEKQWNMMKYDEETAPWVLTEEEEKSAIRNALIKSLEIKERKQLKKPIEINEKEILKQANANKNHLIWQREKLKAERLQKIKERQELEQKCDARYFYRLMRTNYDLLGIDRPFEQDGDNEMLIRIICFFLSRDQRFEKLYRINGNKGKTYYTLRKGLWIRGISGLGKTFLFKLVKDNEVRPVNMLSMIDISDRVKEDGEFKVSGEMIYLDDVGTEEETINHYGTKVNWFKEFIEGVYPNEKIHKNLIISTNLDFDQIQEKYGFRVRSRIKEMFNIINVTGKDRRK